jgi:chaperonin cofactor prefoldin
MKTKEFCKKMLQASLSFVLIGSLIFFVNSCKNKSKRKIISDLEAQTEKTKNEIEKLNQQMESVISDFKRSR